MNFITAHSGGTLYKPKALVLAYFADRYHLRKYGRLVTSDVYIASKEGPIGLGARAITDICGKSDKEYMVINVDSSFHEYSSVLRQAWKRYRYYVESCLKASSHNISSNGDSDLRLFSKSDIEAMEWSSSSFGREKYSDLARVSREYPEWERSFSHGRITREIDIFDFLDDPEGGADVCFALDDEQRSLLREKLLEDMEVSTLLCQ